MVDRIISSISKQCRICKTRFPVYRSLQKVCSPKCAIKLARREADKKEKKANFQAKKNLRDNDRSFQLAKTQALFNKFIRLRDAGNNCISCDKPPKKKNAGHYKSRGAHPELRFEELNCHLQCEYCNTHLSANLSNYRKNLIKKIGLDKVEWLEGPHEAKKYSLDDLKEIQVVYKAKIKELENAVR